MNIDTDKLIKILRQPAPAVNVNEPSLKSMLLALKLSADIAILPVKNLSEYNKAWEAQYSINAKNLIKPYSTKVVINEPMTLQLIRRIGEIRALIYRRSVLHHELVEEAVEQVEDCSDDKIVYLTSLVYMLVVDNDKAYIKFLSDRSLTDVSEAKVNEVKNLLAEHTNSPKQANEEYSKVLQILNIFSGYISDITYGTFNICNAVEEVVEHLVTDNYSEKFIAWASEHFNNVTLSNDSNSEVIYNSLMRISR